ncbi:MAG: tRNA 2-thiouridine(34) synthase MnmA [Cellvibrionaceae bacterium]
MTEKPRVIVGMSGGVDSSVSALLLQQQGYQVEGLFMKNWDEDDGTEYCTAKEDLADAQAVAEKLGIKLHTANFAAEYWDNVFEHFLEEYKAGRTPNPDILCNREIKFKVFLDYAKILGAEYIATGHYTRRKQEGEHTYLLKGLDPNKDQSYFLHAVGEAEFSQTLFPIGDMEKPEVRRIAEEHDLITAKKKDSTGICFIGERRFKDFLQQYLPAQPGSMQTPEGTEIGRHSGLMYYTIGQRQGLHIGGVKGAPEAPWFVVGKDLENNILLVAQGTDHPLLYTDTLETGSMHWINGEQYSPLTQDSSAETLRCKAKTRYRQPDQDCTLYALKSGNDAIGWRVEFDERQRAVTPGQSLVLYKTDEHGDDICLGGSVIETTYNRSSAR